MMKYFTKINVFILKQDTVQTLSLVGIYYHKNNREAERERHIKLSEKSKNDIKLLDRTHCSDMISDDKTLKNDDEDNTHDEDYVTKASKSSFTNFFFSQGMMIWHYFINT